MTRASVLVPKVHQCPSQDRVFGWVQPASDVHGVPGFGQRLLEMDEHAVDLAEISQRRGVVGDQARIGRGKPVQERRRLDADGQRFGVPAQSGKQIRQPAQGECLFRSAALPAELDGFLADADSIVESPESQVRVDELVQAFQQGRPVPPGVDRRQAATDLGCLLGGRRGVVVLSESRVGEGDGMQVEREGRQVSVGQVADQAPVSFHGVCTDGQALRVSVLGGEDGAA